MRPSDMPLGFEDRQRDISSELTPRQRFLVLVLYAGAGGYMDWVPRWLWTQFENEVRSIEGQLDAGWLKAERTAL